MHTREPFARGPFHMSHSDDRGAPLIQSTSNWDRKRVGILALGHAVVDSYGGFLAALLPRLVDKLGISYTLAGYLVTIATLSSSLVQPLYGYWSSSRVASSLMTLAVYAMEALASKSMVLSVILA